MGHLFFFFWPAWRRLDRKPEVNDLKQHLEVCFIAIFCSYMKCNPTENEKQMAGRQKKKENHL